MNTKTIEKNKNKLIAFIESYNNKFIGMKIKDDNNFTFCFIPNASNYDAKSLDNMVSDVKNGFLLAYGSNVREARVELNGKDVYTNITYNYPNHIGSDEMEVMAKDFDRFLASIDAKYQEELKVKLLKDFNNRMSYEKEM